MIKNLDNSQLLLEIKNLVKEEKRITQLVLDYLEEVELRKLYAVRGYPSLFEFCLKELGYSESSAFRRISAMRVIKSIPEAKAKLEEGSVNLSTLSQLQSFIKKEERINGVKLDINEKKDLLLKIENKSQSQCEREFVKLSPEIIKFQGSKRLVTEDLTEIKFMASNKLMAKLDDLQNLLSHRYLQGVAELIEELADMALKNLSPKLEVVKETKVNENHKSDQNSLNSKTAIEYKFKNSLAEVHNDTRSTHQIVRHTPRHTSCYIPQKIKSTVWQRDRGECQYIDPLTKKECLSKSYLEFDHVIPLAKGGQASIENLRLLCFTHNQLQAVQRFSQRHMDKFVRSPQ